MADNFSTLDQLKLDEIFGFNLEYDELPGPWQPARPNPSPSQPKARFGPVDEANITNFISNQENVNTKQKTNYDMRLFKQFCTEQGVFQEPEELSASDLDRLFGNFIAIVKKPDQTEYEPSTVKGFMSSLERRLRFHGYSQTINKNPNFPHSNNAMKAKLAYLKSQGYGSKPHESDELTDEDIDHLFQYKLLGNKTPQQVVNLLHITFSLVMGMRGGKEQRELKWGDIELLTDIDGDEYLQHKRVRTTKTRTGQNPSDIRKFKPKAWNKREKLDRCPVIAYKQFRDHRPQEMCEPESPFFLSINHVKNPNPDTAWFKNCPMCINLIYSLVKKMKLQCPAIQDSKKNTNHSVRKHLMQKCNDIELAPTHAIQISGHKNVASANSYSRLNEKQQKSISAAIFNTGRPHSALENPGPSATVTRSVPESPRGNINGGEILSSLSPTSGSPNFPLSQTNLTYSQQANTTSKNEFQSIFHGTVIHGGTFNFYSRELSSPETKKRKLNN